MKTSLRTHTCGELTAKDAEKEVSIAGWVSTRRDHGGVIFIDLRDRYGLTQIVFNPEFNAKAHSEAENLRREDVIIIKGIVRKRAEGMANPNLDTGEIEVFVNSLHVVAKASTPPIEIDDRKIATDEIRLEYRYLDLRRPQMQKNLMIRHLTSRAAREYMNNNDFLEVETPILVRATPEGARDYVVPSRVNPGTFYALPQSPQLYKQILMISGVDRYYQLARCMRDEDLRADRQPEHTQIDLEMSFCTEKDIMDVVEGLFKHIFKKVLNIELKEKFVILSYKEAMDKYGTDKPDLRFGMQLIDVSEMVAKSDFGVFKDVVKSSGVVKCINAEKDFTRKELDSLISFAQGCGAKGLAWMRVTQQGLESNIAKYFSADLQKEIISKTAAKPGSVLLFIADKERPANEILGKLRLELAKDLGLIKPNEFKFCWIVDFPLFAWDEENQDWTPEHHMFTMPKQECIEYLEKDPGKVIGNLYDIALNGVELGSGSMRISDPAIQERVMKVIGLSKEEANKKFGFLLKAYQYGAPMHGGMGLGLDRLTALMIGLTDIREVIAFPKNKSAQCPMDGSPSTITDAQLKELHIKTDVIHKKSPDVPSEKQSS
jgi:aspartyl-tRNA synthetase